MITYIQIYYIILILFIDEIVVPSMYKVENYGKLSESIYEKIGKDPR
jgi:hypothetical protein